MTKRQRHHAVGLAGLGVLAAAWGFAPGLRTGSSWGGIPARALLLLVALAFLATSGLVWLTASPRAKPGRAPAARYVPDIPQLDFHKTTLRTSLAPVEPGRAAASTRPPAPPRDPRDERILALTRQIDRAGVLLGLHRMSPEGYARIVDALKEERARLETERAREENRRLH